MAHIRYRHLEQVLNKVLKFSPIVGIIGHRQVGKTTLLEQYVKSKYKTFDDEKFYKESQEIGATAVINKYGKSFCAFDEVQMFPSLFSALKERVRINKKTRSIFTFGVCQIYQ